MSRYIPLSASHHREMGYVPNGYRFALQTPCVPLVIDELRQAMASMPIAFTVASDAAGFRLVGLQSLQAECNVYVHVDGRWISGYRPAWYRAYPFRLQPNATSGQQVLCIDEQAEGLTDSPSEAGLRFFDDEGGVTERLQQVMSFLESLEASRELTDTLVAELAGYELIVPWALPARERDDAARPLSGLYRVDEAALRALPGEALSALAGSGALTLAYAQLLSANRLGVVEGLHRLRRRHAPQDDASVGDDVFEDDDDFVFEF